MANLKFSDFEYAVNEEMVEYLVGFGPNGNMKLQRAIWQDFLPFAKDSERNQPNGHAALDANARISRNQLPLYSGDISAGNINSDSINSDQITCVGDLTANQFIIKNNGNGYYAPTSASQNTLYNVTHFKGAVRDDSGNYGGTLDNSSVKTLGSVNDKLSWYETYTRGSWDAFTYKTGSSTITPSYKKGYYTVNGFKVRVHGVFRVTTGPMTINSSLTTAAIKNLPFAPASIPDNLSFSGGNGPWGPMISVEEGGPLGTWMQLDNSFNTVRSGVIVGVTRNYGSSDEITVELRGDETITVPLNNYIKFNFEYIKE